MSDQGLTTERRIAFKTSTSAVYGNAFRAKRMKLFLDLADAVLAVKGTCRVIDLGGEAAYWNGLRDLWTLRNLKITIVNLHTDQSYGDPRLEQLTGDACNVQQFTDNSFDIVHSNSVIEHVGLWSNMQAMAGEVRRLAPAYFLQTPNYWFPQEPHLRVPFIHWMPHPLKRAIVMQRACGFFPRAKTVDEANRFLADSSLLDAPSMAALFPDAKIVRERVGPLTKSLIAIRAPAGSATRLRR